MRIPFVKMHGLGNDFVVLDARHDALLPITSDLARALADRRTGIGCDQLVLLEPSERAWMDDYHATVRAALSPLLDEADRQWLEWHCAPL